MYSKLINNVKQFFINLSISRNIEETCSIRVRRESSIIRLADKPYQ